LSTTLVELENTEINFYFYKESGSAKKPSFGPGQPEQVANDLDPEHLDF